MTRVILSGFDFHRQHFLTFLQDEVNFSLGLAVEIEQIKSMRQEFLSREILKHGAVVHINFAAKELYLDIIGILTCQQPHIILEQFEQIPLLGKPERIFGLIYIEHGDCHACIFHPQKTILEPAEFEILIEVFQYEPFILLVKFRGDEIEYLIQIQFVIRVILGDVSFVKMDYSLLRLDYLTYVVGLNILGNSIGHSAHHQVKKKHSHHPFMDDLVDFPARLIAGSQMFQHFWSHAYCATKFLQIQRIHVENIHISYRFRPQIIEFHSKKRTAHGISIAPFFDQKFNHRNDVRIFLDFIEKDKCLTRYKRNIRYRRKTQQHILSAICPIEQSDKLRL